MDQILSNFKRCILILTIFLVAPLVAAQQSGYSLNEELFYRINFGRAADVKILLDKGADPNAVSNIGEYALLVAISRDDAETAPIVKALLDKGANPNVRDKSGLYPIVNAAQNNRTGIVADLLAKGADFHVKSPDGRTLTDIATANHNMEMAKLIQAQIDKEAANAASLRSPDRFKQMIKTYYFDSCLYQYWSFFLGSRQSPDQDQDTKAKVEHVKTDITDIAGQIQKYYPFTPAADLQRISSDAAQKIYEILDAMVSNSNRRNQGVGREEDANVRCRKILDSSNIEFAPSSVK